MCVGVCPLPSDSDTNKAGTDAGIIMTITGTNWLIYMYMA